MKVIFTDYFKKQLGKIKSLNKEDIVKLLEKYPDTINLKTIDNLENSKVLKGYLLSKKVRILILFQFIKGSFLPISIAKKESFKGKNIMKQNYIDLFGNDIDKILIDKNNNNFEEIEIKKVS